MNIFSSPIFLSLISGFIGSIIGSIITSTVSYKSIKKEKQYLIDIKMISDRILSPLLSLYNELQLRQNIYSNLIPEKVYDKIDSIMEKNLCWILCSNSKIKECLFHIKEYSLSRNEELLMKEMKVLWEKANDSLKKYRIN
ncbi:hypothetical protein [Clostridium coskatii]|uniref:Uncharacterized protein n=1 Tax=Clostridium coskatii TaxID=1705578 RepID=A0A166RYE3_9CLOT|nr:hypothetical protein [Clostridium coskatii]OAA91341.1 hypothetical protein WX73_01751 [Clostridium coskatii]OBR93973.1 hypothetical protein CLCOS_21090 [Clostridium coskatii]